MLQYTDQYRIPRSGEGWVPPGLFTEDMLTREEMWYFHFHLRYWHQTETC